MPQKNTDAERRRSFIKWLSLPALFPLSALSQTRNMNFVLRTRNDPVELIVERILSEAYRRLEISLKFVQEAYPEEKKQRGIPLFPDDLYSYKSAEILADQRVRLPEAIFQDELVIFCSKTSPIINSLEDLRGLRLGITNLHADSSELQKLLKDVKFEKTYSLKRALEMMLTGKTDVVIGSRISGLHGFKELEAKGYFQVLTRGSEFDRVHTSFNRSEIKVPELVIGPLPVYHHVPRELLQEIPRLQKILSQMRTERITEKIQQKIIDDVHNGKNEFDVPAPAEIRRLSELREMPYSEPMQHEDAIKTNLLSNESAALKQLRMRGTRWNWSHPSFQSAYAEALKAVSEIQNADWDKCTYPVMQKYASSTESLAASYALSMPLTLSYQQFRTVLNFFESKLGSKYRQFLRFSKSAYLELDLVRQKRELGYPGFTKKYLVPAEDSSELRLLRNSFELFFGKTEIYLLDFIAYLPDFIQRINAIVNQQEQMQVLRFEDSEAAAIDRKVVREWQTKIGMEMFDSDRKCETSRKLQTIKLQS